ncbi:MAG TPA: right-handed parallel beta-helix repeat-containing protein [Brevefilum sp.]
MKIQKVIFILIMFSLVFLFPQSAIKAEIRTVTYIVNSDTDAPDVNLSDGICATDGGNCTLHAAIENANQDGQASVIQFASRFQDSLGTRIIDETLPEITGDNTIIDASDRWDYVQDRPGVEIGCIGCDKLMQISSNNNTIRGVLFSGGSHSGLYVDSGDGNKIGDLENSNRNVFLDNLYGLYLTNGINNSIINNYFGTISGDDIPGGSAGYTGIWLQYDSFSTISQNLVVGYTTPLSTGHEAYGIMLYVSDHCAITDNIIGLNKDGNAALGNSTGIFLAWGGNNTIGPDNIIAGNTSDGVTLYDTSFSTVSSNIIGDCGELIGNNGDGILDFNPYLNENSTSIADNQICINGEHGIYENSKHTVIQGNDIMHNFLDGIYVAGTSTVLSLSQEEQYITIMDNNIAMNKGNGINLDEAMLVTIESNHIGVFEEIEAPFAGNLGDGILIQNGAKNNIIGWFGSNQGNLIGYNYGFGIRLDGSETQENHIIGNIIGAPEHMNWSAGNGLHGIAIFGGAHNNIVGSNDSGAENIILGNGLSGIGIDNSDQNLVYGNYIGTNAANAHWGNGEFGVVVSGVDSLRNQIGFNEIAYNGTLGGVDEGQAGILIYTSEQTMITRNSIHDNDGPGISLMNGGNANMPAPIFNEATCYGWISGTATANSRVQIFSDDGDEGRIWEATIMADSLGNWSWFGKVNGPFLTATARNDEFFNTSGFSLPYEVGICNSIYLPLILKD